MSYRDGIRNAIREIGLMGLVGEASVCTCQRLQAAFILKILVCIHITIDI